MTVTMVNSRLPALGKVKAEYHVASDTHYVLGWFWREDVKPDDYPDEADLYIKVEKSGGYLDDTDTREEIAVFLVTSLKELIPSDS